jgi:hypothetical protein
MHGKSLKTDNVLLWDTLSTYLTETYSIMSIDETSDRERVRLFSIYAFSRHSVYMAQVFFVSFFVVIQMDSASGV